MVDARYRVKMVWHDTYLPYIHHRIMVMCHGTSLSRAACSDPPYIAKLHFISFLRTMKEEKNR